MKQPFAEYCAATGEFEPIDLAFADFMLRFARAPECEELYLAALFASRAVRLSHSCCPLRELAGTLFPEIPAEGQRQFRLPGCDAWLERLSAPALAAAVSRYPACHDAGFPTPLAIDGAGRLYLQRYLVYELQVAQGGHAPAPAARSIRRNCSREHSRHSSSTTAAERQQAGPISSGWRRWRLQAGTSP